MKGSRGVLKQIHRKHGILKTTISNTLIDELTCLIEQWAQKKKLLEKNQQLSITVSIKSPPQVILKMEENAPTSIELDDLLSQPIAILKLRGRASNCLDVGCVRFIGELVRKKGYDLCKIRNFGKKSCREVEEKLQQLGLTLDMNVPLGPRERTLVLEGDLGNYCSWEGVRALRSSGVSSVKVFLSKTEEEIITMLESYDTDIQSRRWLYHHIHKALRDRGLQQ